MYLAFNSGLLAWRFASKVRPEFAEICYILRSQQGPGAFFLVVLACLADRLRHRAHSALADSPV
jgi:hypothetical protein